MKFYFKSIIAIAFAVVMSLPLNAQQNGSIRIAAHRGFWDCDATSRTENTIASLREAQNHGLWGSEFDIHLTKDGEIVVHHDRHIEGVDIQTTDYSILRQYRLANGELMPSLDEYLSQGEKCAETVLVLEFKSQYSEERENQLVDLSLQKIREHGLYDPSRIMFISFSLNICKRIAELAPEFTNQYLNGDIAPAELHQMGINGIDYQFKKFYKNPQWVKEAHELGMSVNAWTVNKADDIKAMIELGVDCITTNAPLLARELLGTAELRIAPQQVQDNPLAASDAVVTFGNARFTMLTSRLIRMEWAEDAKFEDRATLGVVNRNLPVPSFKVKKSGNKLVIKTDALELTYVGDKKFDEKNLAVNFI